MHRQWSRHRPQSLHFPAASQRQGEAAPQHQQSGISSGPGGSYSSIRCPTAASLNATPTHSSSQAASGQTIHCNASPKPSSALVRGGASVECLCAPVSSGTRGVAPAGCAPGVASSRRSAPDRITALESRLPFAGFRLFRNPSPTALLRSVFRTIWSNAQEAPRRTSPTERPSRRAAPTEAYPTTRGTDATLAARRGIERHESHASSPPSSAIPTLPGSRLPLLIHGGPYLCLADSTSGGSCSPFLNSCKPFPRLPITSGNRPGPKTSRTTTSTTSSSPTPISNMDGHHRSASHQPQRLVILWPGRLRLDTAPSTEPSTPLTARRLLQRRQILLPRSSRRGRVGPHPRTAGQFRAAAGQGAGNGGPSPAVGRRVEEAGGVGS